MTALSYGALSVEADVWLVNGELYVGHDVAALRKDRTFDSLYVQPLLRILDQKNPANEFTTFFANQGYTERNGVFDTKTSSPVQVLVDVKTDGQKTWPFVVKALEPLRKKGYLSYYNKTASANAIQSRPITIIGTGNTPLNQLVDLDYRDYFFDAPLVDLNATFTPTLSPLASTNFGKAINWNGKGPANETQVAIIGRLIDEAHNRGIQARFWNTPAWPIYARNNVWKQLLEQSTDWLNADDLPAVSAF